MAILNPYLHFRGQAREAGEFYQSVFGGELTVTTFEQGGMTDHAGESIDPSWVMHSQLHTDEGFDLMVSDAPTNMELGDNGDISLSGTEDALLRGYFEKLAEGGTLGVPLEVAPWGDAFGQTADKFGVQWMVNISGSGG